MILQSIAPEGRRKKEEGRKINYFQCPMPNARCPMPDAQCPMPDAQCPMPCLPDAQRPMPLLPKKMREQSTIADCPRLPIL
ncbi:MULTISPECIES: hypothetical protein [unclassified Microcoleus]|uniref:hypothetical protein n=1 Tax=unclassified Microcoleus TaxID=2642155 RepID=UPI002FD44E83